jgi:hypothetical protein
MTFGYLWTLLGCMCGTIDSGPCIRWILGFGIKNGYDIHHLWCWVGLCICESVVVFHPSRCEVTVWGSMLWFEQWLEWWRWLIPSWHVVLESAQDRIFGIDTPRQHMPPRVRYGTACLLIKNTIGSLSCSVGWGMASYFVTNFVNRLSHMVQEGTFVRETLALQSGDRLFGKP